jgi:glycosyltransferase involved in cell wall biosynthesis
MKILHVPFSFYPDPVGGTEVYVYALAREQKKAGLEPLIAAPGCESQSYVHEGLSVHRFKVPGTLQDLSEIYGKGIPGVAEAFDQILQAQKPDVVHLHAFTPGISLALVEKAKKRGSAVVFTYHTPTVSCTRGTLMRWGQEVCDGHLEVSLCTDCTLQGLGVPRALSLALGHWPPAWGKLVGRAGLSGGPWTALRMSHLLQQRFEVFAAFMQHVDRIVAPCNWVRTVLIRNQVPAEKITISRQGLLSPELSTRSSHAAFPKDRKSPLKVAYLGRLEAAKGIEVLIQALAECRDVPLQLDLYGIAQEGTDHPYVRHLQKLIQADVRIAWKAPVSNSEIIGLLQTYDLLAVPSQGLETGPLVVLEAFAAGIPILGSNLGGIAELVQSEVNGLLVPPPSIPAWSAALRRISADRTLLATWARAIPPSRQMSDVEKDMDALYGDLLCLR